MRMQSLSGTIKSNKHDGLHMQFMSFAAGCMCALSGPNGLGFYSFFSSSSHFLGPASNDQRLPAANNSGSKPLGHFIEVFPSHCLSLSRFFFFFFCTLPPCNLWAREVEMASPVACGASVEYWGTLS